MIALVFFAQTREFWIGASILCTGILVCYYFGTREK